MKTAKAKLLLFLILILTSAAMRAVAADERTHRAVSSCCVEKESPAPMRFTEKSLYQLAGSWTNDFAQAFQLATLKGRPQIVVMFFSSCQYACPMLVYKMKQIGNALPENIRTNLGFVLVSFDTERDTPEKLHQYRERQELPANWTLLSGAPDDVLDLAALLGVKFKKDRQGQFLHSNVLTILNRDGEIAFQESGLSSDGEGIAHRVEALINQ
jgi:protein SCO1/2